MAVEHSASATWDGDLMSGFGTFWLGSGAVSGVSLSWRARAEDASVGTSPEEDVRRYAQRAVVGLESDAFGARTKSRTGPAAV